MAIPYYGDFPEDHVAVRIPFNTFDSNDPTESITLTHLDAADITVQIDGNATPISTDGSSVVININSITGNHIVLIDTSVDVAYSTGSEYQVRVEGTTIDVGNPVNAWIGAFSIERAGGVLALLKGTNSLANIEDKIDTMDTVVDLKQALAAGAAGFAAIDTVVDLTQALAA